MGVSEWCNWGSVIKCEVNVAISCGGGSNGGSVAGTECGLNPWVSVAIRSWLGLSHAISFDGGSVVSGCGKSWGRVGVKGGCVRESDEVGRWEVYRTWVMKNKNGDVYQ